MLVEAKNGHINIQDILYSNFIATYIIRSPTQDSKKLFCAKKGDDITRFDGTLYSLQHLFIAGAFLLSIFIITSKGALGLGDLKMPF